MLLLAAARSPGRKQRAWNVPEGAAPWQSSQCGGRAGPAGELAEGSYMRVGEGYEYQREPTLPPRGQRKGGGVRNFSVAKDRNQTQTSVGRKSTVSGRLWGQYGNDGRTSGGAGRSRDSLFTDRGSSVVRRLPPARMRVVHGWATSVGRVPRGWGIHVAAATAQALWRLPRLYLAVVTPTSCPSREP